MARKRKSGKTSLIDIIFICAIIVSAVILFLRQNAQFNVAALILSLIPIILYRKKPPVNGETTKQKPQPRLRNDISEYEIRQQNLSYRRAKAIESQQSAERERIMRQRKAEQSRLERAQIVEELKQEEIRKRDAEIEEQQRKILEEEIQRKNEELFRRLALDKAAELDRMRREKESQKQSTSEVDNQVEENQNESDIDSHIEEEQSASENNSQNDEEEQNVGENTTQTVEKKKKYTSEEAEQMAKLELRKINYLDGHSFEYWCAEVLECFGFIGVRVTRGSGDHGGDIIAYTNNQKWVFQCKRYNKNVGNDAVKEAFYAKTFYNCNKAVVITNSQFTSSAMEGANKTDVDLWGREMLFFLLKRIYSEMEE